MTAEPSAAAGRAPIRSVLTAPHVPRVFTACLIGRLPTGMAPLAIVLAVRADGGDYRLAGLLAAVYAVSAAVCGPVLGRLIDRSRQSPLLLGCAAVALAAFVLLAFANPSESVAPAVVAAALAGGATPQLEPCLRVLWPSLLDDDRTVRAAFSLDAAGQELIFVFGPLVVIATTALGGAHAGLIAAGVLGFIGTLWYATARPVRAWRGSIEARHWAGPLRGPGVIRLFLGLLFVGAMIGTFTVAIAGYAEADGAPGAAGWLIAANAAGALAGGIAYTGAPEAAREDRRILLLMALLTAGYLPLVLVPPMIPMAVLAFVSGCALPAVLASAFGLVARMVPAGTVTEAHAWMITSFGVGNAAGAALAGAALDLVSVRSAFLIAAAAGCIATLVIAPALLRDERDPRQPQ